jgi:hypothetical protein
MESRMTTRSVSKKKKRESIHITMLSDLYNIMSGFLCQPDLTSLYLTSKCFNKSSILTPHFVKIITYLKIFDKKPNNMLFGTCLVLRLPLNIVVFLTKTQYECLHYCEYPLMCFLRKTVNNQKSTLIICENPKDVSIIVMTLCFFLLRFSHCCKNNDNAFVPFFNENISINPNLIYSNWAEICTCICGEIHRFLPWVDLRRRVYYVLSSVLYYIHDKPEYNSSVKAIRSVYKGTVPSVTPMQLQPDPIILTGEPIQLKLYSTPNSITGDAILNTIKSYVNINIIGIRRFDEYQLNFICKLLEMCDHFFDSNLDVILIYHLKHIRFNHIYGRLSQMEPNQHPKLACQILCIFQFLPDSSRKFVPIIFEIIQHMEKRLETEYQFGIDDDKLLFRGPLLSYFKKYPDEVEKLCNTFMEQQEVDRTPLINYLLVHFKK